MSDHLISVTMESAEHNPVVLEESVARSSSKRKRDGGDYGDDGANKAGRSYEVLVAINRRAKSIGEAFMKLIRKTESFQSSRTEERQDRFNNLAEPRDDSQDYPQDLDQQIEDHKNELITLLKTRNRRDRRLVMNTKPSLEAFVYVPGGDILHYEGIQWRVNAPDTLLQEVFLARHGLELNELQNKSDVKKRWKIFDSNTDVVIAAPNQVQVPAQDVALLPIDDPTQVQVQQEVLASEGSVNGIAED